MNISQKLKNRRKELGLTMLEVAKRAGVSEATVSRWESGDIANMRRDKIVSLANALQVEPSFIMNYDGTKNFPLSSNPNITDTLNATTEKEITEMPELSRFFNIIIRMIYNDTSQHHKPHIHVQYNEYEATIGIDGELLAGSLPVKQLRLVEAWIVIHEEELYKAWNNAVRSMPFDKIAPLS